MVYIYLNMYVYVYTHTVCVYMYVYGEREKYSIYYIHIRVVFPQSGRWNCCCKRLFCLSCCRLQNICCLKSSEIITFLFVKERRVSSPFVSALRTIMEVFISLRLVATNYLMLWQPRLLIWQVQHCRRRHCRRWVRQRSRGEAAGAVGVKFKHTNCQSACVQMFAVGWRPTIFSDLSCALMILLAAVIAQDCCYLRSSSFLFAWVI